MTAPTETRDLVPTAVDPQIAAAIAMTARLEPLKNALGLSDFTNEELQLFAMVAERSRLDPFAKQIYAVKRKGKVVFQTGIDGFRGSAEETNEYRGSDEPEFGDTIATPFPHPEWARVVVHRQYPDGSWLHQPAKVFWDEFYPGDGADSFMWRKMPRNQLAKCAEAAGFRKAFPKRFGQVYATEEMEQADAAELARPVAPTARERVADRVAQIQAQVGGDVEAGSGDPVDGAKEVERRPVTAGSPAPSPAETAAPAAARATAEAVEPEAPGAEAILTEPVVGSGADAPGVTAGELRDWLRTNVIGITDALKVAREQWGDGIKTLDTLTDGQRAQLKTVLAP